MTKVYKIGSIFLLEKMIQSSKYSYHFYNLASCGRVDVFRYLEKKGMMVPEEEDAKEPILRLLPLMSSKALLFKLIVTAEPLPRAELWVVLSVPPPIMVGPV